MDKRFNLDYIVERRKELGLKQEDVAERLGMKCVPNYCKYENGDYKIKAEMIPALARALDCPIENFFCAAN